MPELAAAPVLAGTSVGATQWPATRTGGPLAGAELALLDASSVAVGAVAAGRIRAVGVDMVAISPLAAQLDQPGTRFASVFTPGEWRYAQRAAGGAAQHLAVRWAAKEALVKAWSSLGYGRPPVRAAVDLREIEVRLDAWGCPAIRLHGQVAQALTTVAIHVSLTHDKEADIAAAIVVIDSPGERPDLAAAEPQEADRVVADSASAACR